ncbi:hypothetical protein PROFUN_09357 [Planoprotostelium fungivorum]|uniref:Uncharacterized protein n=1 Tax=Planoprotostelium fungivorum TaxID=1890364 RepID=A0A2P6NGW4_9EUKA|nr:hypothetical protein PROFUN_09357 [Planoprotostelium fungivorum]
MSKSLILLFLCISVNGLDWSNLNEKTLKALDPSVWTNATIEDISVIPPPALLGMTEAQMIAINASAASGFNGQQISELTYTCGGINAEVFDKLTSNAFGGIVSRCMMWIPPSTFSSVRMEQLANLSTDAITGFTSQQIQMTDPPAFAGFSATQTSSFDRETCGGFDSQRLRYFQASSFSGFTRRCVSRMTIDAFSNVTSQQIGHMTPVGVSGFTADQLKNISLMAVSGFTGDQMEEMDDDACAGIGYPFMSHLTVEAVGGIVGRCMRRMMPMVLSNATAEQLSALQPATFSDITQEQIYHIDPSAAPGVNSTQISMLDRDSCPGLRPQFVKNILPSSFSGFLTDCVRRANASAFSLVDAVQLSNMTVDGVSGFDDDKMAELPDEAAVGLSVDQAGSLEDACGGLRSSFIRLIRAETFRGFSRKCLYRSSPRAFSVIDSSQLNEIRDCSGFKPVDVAGFLPSVFASANRFCFGNLSIEQITPQQIEALPADMCAYFTLDQMYFELNGTTSRSFNLSQITSFSVEAVKGLTADFYGNLTQKYGQAFIDAIPLEKAFLKYQDPAVLFKEKVVNGIVPMVVQWMDVQNSSRVSWLQLAALNISSSPESWGGDLIKGLSNVTVAGIRSDMVSRLSDSAVKAFTMYQMRYFLLDASQMLSPHQVSVFTPQAMAGFPLFGLSHFTKEQISALTPAQVSSLPVDILKNCTFVDLLSQEQRSTVSDKRKDAVEACTSTGGTSGQGGEKEKQPDNKKTAIVVGSVGGALLGVGIIATVLYIWQKRRGRRDSGYEAI